MFEVSILQAEDMSTEDRHEGKTAGTYPFFLGFCDVFSSAESRNLLWRLGVERLGVRFHGFLTVYGQVDDLTPTH